jgi:hypothetical protein
MNPTQKQIDYFEARTNAHIATVIFFGRFLGLDFTGHDASKLYEPERTPYIWLTEKEAGRADLNPTQKQQIQIAIKHHYANNPHHPEFYKNIADMPGRFLKEAMCDWAAMQYEIDLLGYQSKYSSLDDFYFNHAIPKYGFTDAQKHKSLHHASAGIAIICKTGINGLYKELDKIWLPVQRLK